MVDNLTEHLVKTGKMYYSTSEVADMLGVTASLLRFWESEFPHLRPKTNSKGDRQYRRQDIENIKQIYVLLKVQGLTMKGAKEHLRNNKGNKKENTIKKLEEMRKFLLALRHEILANANVSAATVNIPSDESTEPSSSEEGWSKADNWQ